MKDCIFCRMASGEIPVEKLASVEPRQEGQGAFIIRDRNPAAPEHLLVIPNEHVADLTESVTRHGNLMITQCLTLAANYARQHLPNGYRVVTNTGADAGQVVKHLHFHVLGGGPLKGCDSLWIWQASPIGVGKTRLLDPKEHSTKLHRRTVSIGEHELLFEVGRALG